MAAAFLFTGVFAYAQSGSQETRIEPIFDAEPDGLVWVEAEDAMTTNFAGEATLDYGSSAYRVMQLNKDGQSKSAPYYAEYTILVESPGDWSLWIGGTPPGPESELAASFVSPLRLIVDGGTPAKLYREDIEVNEQYSANNHWFVVKEALRLSAGAHTIRFEIAETRKYDSRFYFFLDAFFLLRSDSTLLKASLDAADLPGKFPKNLADRSIDLPYLSIPQYEYAIQTSPKDPDRYLLLAQVYNLIGDHGSAIKTLARGRVVSGYDPRFTLQMAKSRIWSGEVDEGIRLYREYLSTPEADTSIWAEAAKISAWLMKYQDAEKFYADALEAIPEDMNLRVNQALTLLWEGKVREGERLLARLWKGVSADASLVAELGEIYMVSGYPDKAIKTYSDGIESHPERLGLYLRLSDAYARTNKPEDQEKTNQLIRDRFIASEKLGSVLEARKEASRQKYLSLEGYRKRLMENPDDLELRLELLRAYYWNGMLEQALAEGNNILANRMYGVFMELDGDLENTYRLLDLLHIHRLPVTEVISSASLSAAEVRDAGELLTRAIAKHELARKGKDAKKLEKAAKDLAGAQEALASAVAKAVDIQGWTEFFLPDATALVEQARTEARATREDAELLEKLAPWRWDPAGEMEFLASIHSINALAYHCGSRILLLEGKPVLPPAVEPATAATRNLLTQAALWTTDALDPDTFKPGEYYSYGQDVADALAMLGKDEPGVSAYTDATPGEALEALANLDKVIVDGQAAAHGIDEAIEALMGRARARLRVRAYQYDTETQQDRREIGDVYLKLKRPAEAVLALERVLAVNPSDIVSVFTLGRALDLSGDWSGAMEKYRYVHELNPRYESAVSSYNRLAGVHAQRLSAEFSSSVDSNESRTLAMLVYQVPVNSSFGITASYDMDHRKLHVPVLSTFPESISLHTFQIAVPYSIQGTGFTLTGIVGGSAQNKLEDFLPAPIADITGENLADYLAVAPRMGAELEWKAEGLSLGGVYRFGQIEETFYKDRIPNYRQAAKLFASYYMEAPSRSFARSLGASLSATGARVFQAITDGVVFYQGSATAMVTVGSIIAASPPLNLDLTLEGGWQDSSVSDVEDFYSPWKVLTVKAGPKLSVRFGTGSPTELAIAARFWPGLYSEDQIGRLSLDGGLSFDLNRRGSTMYLKLDGAYTAAVGSGAPWWSGTVGIGAKVALGDYIIP